MNTTIRRTGAIAVIAVTGILATGCGSDSASTTIGTDDPAADQLLDDINDPTASTDFDVTGLKSATNDFRGQIDSLPAGIQTEYDALSTSVDIAASATGADVAAALRDVSGNLDEIDRQLTDAGDTVNADAHTAWDRVKAEFDKLGV